MGVEPELSGTTLLWKIIKRELVYLPARTEILFSKMITYLVPPAQTHVAPPLIVVGTIVIQAKHTVSNGVQERADLLSV